MALVFVPPSAEELAARGLDGDGNPVAPAPKAKTTKKAPAPAVVEENTDGNAV